MYTYIYKYLHWEFRKKAKEEMIIIKKNNNNILKLNNVV